MKKILFLLFILQDMHSVAQLPHNNQTSTSATLDGASRNPNRGLVTELKNLPQTISSMMPTISNIQKLLLSSALIGLGYQCCKYGLSKYNKATKLYNKVDDTEKGKNKLTQSKWHSLTGSGFLLAGAFILLSAQRIAHLAYGQ